jgi:hypothetical protein
MRCVCNKSIEIVRGKSQRQQGLIPSAALCHCLAFSYKYMRQQLHASVIEWRETNMIKSLGSRQNVHVLNDFVFALDMAE